MEPSTRHINSQLRNVLNQLPSDFPPEGKKQIKTVLGAVKSLTPASQRTARALLGVGIALTVVAIAAAVALAIFSSMGAIIPMIAIAAYTIVAVAGALGIAMMIAGSVLLHKENLAKKQLLQLAKGAGQAAQQVSCNLQEEFDKDNADFDKRHEEKMNQIKEMGKQMREKMAQMDRNFNARFSSFGFPPPPMQPLFGN